MLLKKDISPFENLFFSQLNLVLVHECDCLGYNLIFTSVTIDHNDIIFPYVIKSYDIDGVIFNGDMDPLVINGIEKFAIPYIIVDSHFITSDFLSV